MCILFPGVRSFVHNNLILFYSVLLFFCAQYLNFKDTRVHIESVFEVQYYAYTGRL